MIRKTNRHQNTVMKTVLCLQLAALLFTTAFSGSALAAGVPFAGVIEGTEDFNPIFDPNAPVGSDPIGLDIVGSGGGQATQLGRFTATWQFDIDLASAGPHPGLRTFVADNGDELWSEGSGTGTPPDADPNFNQTVVEDHAITGGTGRFKGATGSFTVERVVYDVRPGVDLVTSGSFNGYIIFAEEGEPFEGVVEGSEDFNPVFDPNAPAGSDPIGLDIVGSGEGEARLLGRFTATWGFDVDLASPGPHPGARTFVADNGDELWSEATGIGTPPDADPNFNQTVTEEHVITGGTGRFEGATGSFTVERVVYDVRPGVDLVTSGSFSGYIMLVPQGEPFQGLVSGFEDFNPVFDPNDPSATDPTGLDIVGSGGGIATTLGRFTATWGFDIDLASPGPHPGARTFVADNGDELWSEATGTGTPPDADPNFNQTVVEDNMIVGGTGRFEGATGSFTVNRVVYDVRPGVNLATSGSFSGYIILSSN